MTCCRGGVLVVCRAAKIKTNNLTFYSQTISTHNSNHILIADSGCDQMLITNIWTIINYSNNFVTMFGAFVGRNKGE